jgi:hypothetical protein
MEAKIKYKGVTTVISDKLMEEVKTFKHKPKKI